jgi:hypothetical protein
MDFQIEEFKTIEATGEIEGYAATYGNVDMGGDIIEHGAFKEFALTKDGQIRVLMQHQFSAWLGKGMLHENDRGMKLKAKLNIGVPRVREVYEFMKDGTLDGLSVGYDVLPGGAEMDKNVRRLTKLKLWEVSVVTFGMNPKALISSVKACDIETIREFEGFLREVGGFSKREATIIATRGFKALETQRDAGDEAVLQPVHDWLKNYSPTFLKG